MTTLGLDFLGPYCDLDYNSSRKMMSKAGSSAPGGSTTSSSSEDNNLYNNARPLSTLESSGNENNQRFTASRFARSVSLARGAVERDSSTMATTGGSQLRSKSPSSTSQVLKDSSSRSRQHKSYEDANVTDNDTVVIEEKRKRTHGEGYTLHRYLRGRLLGKGGFAKVYLCTAMDTSKTYAVKIVPKSNLVKARARQKLQAEIKIHRTLKHKHICEYKHFFEDRTNCYILLELCHNQSLNEMIKRRKRLTEPEAAFFLEQLLQAVFYMHESNVIHRDLKLGNLFLDKHMHIKVGDLGLATRLEDKDEKRKTICGTPNYIAPEVIQGDKATRGHSFEVDIWSMGVILYTVLVGKPPYEAKDVKATYQRIIANEYSFPNHISLSESVKDLITAMLRSNPAERPTLDEIACHPFLVNTGIPPLLPSSVLHVAPTWRMSDDGDVVCNDGTSSRKSRKAPVPRRQPFGSHNPNTSKSSNSLSRAKKEKSERPTIDVQKIVKTALTMSGGCTGGGTPAFHIYDETEGTAQPDSAPKPPPSRSSSKGEDNLVARAKALSIGTGSYPASSTRESPAASVGKSTGTDSDVIQKMLEQLDTVLEVTETRRAYYRANSPRPATSRGQPLKWVTRYVDYTSKYGLGFLLNDGSSGVYFNDSTKTVLEAEGETFQYIERKKAEDSDTRRIELSVATHTLSSYPESLKKKVTLLKHFRNYLIEQQKKAEQEDSAGPTSFDPSMSKDLVYVKKWIRTKHAILFRLSNQTIQVVFYDQSEVLLTPDERYITYVDKNHNRQTYNFTDELVGSFAELEKRLKYTRDIMSQLLSGHRR